MKTIYKALFFGVALMVGFISCDDKHEKMPPTGGLDNAEKLAVGTYIGEWTRNNVTLNTVEYGTGSITFSVDEELGNNVAVIGIESGDTDLGVDQGIEAACNISRLSSGVLAYWNSAKTNPFGTSFYGRISPEGEVTIAYTKFITQNRREREFLFTFVGRKQ